MVRQTFLHDTTKLVEPTVFRSQIRFTDGTHL